MENSPPPSGHDHDTPSFQPWIGWLAAAFVPAVLALMVPMRWRLPLMVIAGVATAIGFALLLRQERRSARLKDG